MGRELGSRGTTQLPPPLARTGLAEAFGLQPKTSHPVTEDEATLPYLRF
jgi:hypothetical protein